mgnify:CR=1 FL=1
MLIAAAEATTDNSMFFFGFMGIASALVFASNAFFKSLFNHLITSAKTWDLLTVPLRVASVSALWVSSSQS